MWVALIAVAWIGLMIWRYGTASGKAFGARAEEMKADRKPQPISAVGTETAAGLACPKCGGTQFKVQRKLSTKLAFGAASMLGQARHVRCVTCGTQYQRG
jgi:hypothetical protein